MTWRYKIVVGDCLDVLKQGRSNRIDAVVCDPPAAIGFMGKDWDSFGVRGIKPETSQRQLEARPGSPFGGGGGIHIADAAKMRDPFIEWLTARLLECFRVLKPGGYALVWALPRTSHWTATALENAGFEIRDRVSHFFGTGFPKGGMISKAIDKKLGVEPTVVGENPNHRPVSGVEYEGIYQGGNTGSKHLTVPTSPEAKQWEGWGSALKPACEDWWLARKPFKGTLVENVLKLGTGALNIDACRIPTADKLERKLGKSTESDSGWKSTNRSEIAGKDGGRWPAHVVLDEEAAALLDTQSGITKSGAMKRTVGAYEGESVTGMLRGDSGPHNQHGDEGGASRFFYCAKPSKRERNEGLPEGMANKHPTVKSVELMRWLVRLITPPDGIVLDPFMGSGSTGVACMEEGFRFVGIELEKNSADIAHARIAHAHARACEEQDNGNKEEESKGGSGEPERGGAVEGDRKGVAAAEDDPRGSGGQGCPEVQRGEREGEDSRS